MKPDTSDPDKIRVSRFTPGEEDRRVVVRNSVDSVLRGVSAIGGTYGDAVQILRSAKEKGFLADQLALDPLPRALRLYYREDANADSEG